MLDISDHNSLTITFNMERGERNRKKIVINKEYWDMKNEKKMEIFADECAEKMNKEKELSVTMMESIMVEMANKYLITKVRIKRDNRIKKYNKEIDQAIK